MTFRHAHGMLGSCYGIVRAHSQGGLHAAQLAELAGMEFFDATVKLDGMAAAIVKVRTK